MREKICPCRHFKYVFLLFILPDILSGCNTTSTDNNTLFTKLPEDSTGVHFSNHIEPDFSFNILEYDYFYNGGGVAAADFNNDGLTDLFFTGNQVPSKLYLNTGNLRFQDVTAQAEINTENWATGVATGDVNQDGLTDIYICYAGYLEPEKRTRQLYVNQGTNKNNVPVFAEKAAEYGLAGNDYATAAAFLDYDRDGDPDLFVINHDRAKINPNFPKPKNIAVAVSKDHLYRNETINGKTTFREVSDIADINGEGYSLGTAISDINMDGWPDIYVANDFVYDDLLYINNKNGTFTESLQQYIMHSSRFSMGCDIADYNNDGLPDIVVADMLPPDNKRQKIMNTAVNNYMYEQSLSLGYCPQYSRNTLQLNNGRNAMGSYTFSEIGQLAGIHKTDWSWSPLFADLDNDGWKDLFITNGIPRDITNNDFVAYRSQVIQASKTYDDKKKELLAELEKLQPVNAHNYLYINDRDLRFTDKSRGSGIDEKNFSNGAVYADLDNDGDLDIVRRIKKGKLFVAGTEFRSNDSTFFSPDGVHPFGETGHRYYTEMLMHSLNKIRRLSRASDHILRPPYTNDNMDNATTYPIARAMAGPDTEIRSLSDHDWIARYMPEVYRFSDSTLKLRFRFRGTSIGLMDVIGPFSTMLKIQIDNDAPRTVTRFDSYCRYTRCSFFFIDSLPPGLHDITIQIMSGSIDKWAILNKKPEEFPDLAPFKIEEWWAGRILVNGGLFEKTSD